MDPFVKNLTAYRLEQVMGDWRPGDEIFDTAMWRLCKRWESPTSAVCPLWSGADDASVTPPRQRRCDGVPAGGNCASTNQVHKVIS